MPLFGNKFSPKKTSPRKSTSLSNLTLDQTEKPVEFGLDYGPIKVKLGHNEVAFEDGQWISANGGSGVSNKEFIKMKKQNQQLTEENNLLKIKLEILLDMLSETTAEAHLQENEIEELRALTKKSGKRKGGTG
ncbi:protein chibby homolog 1-like [Lingula anatina]|uniref:Protein chibby homolog 1-like n=1 Tax=Lingula anatina TaxID=7574 RepID=A0A1S3JDV7_LINAN|nr:protein chibby homolog 1-like [Lingula anatina]XP_013408600.1 protein chibby homolog 1-like [Lingula anatina]|eukprot:XP_013408598.1 protein chibby homolog 1-like [Lingula anatina]